ncbi:hypothetical protein [Luteimonas sp. TWI1437]|uniref:hypothetical protein n=1 Tax=unclassified Luteimonas TaxID=2629088 RepID=UPI0032080DA1
MALKGLAASVAATFSLQMALITPALAERLNPGYELTQRALEKALPATSGQTAFGDSVSPADGNLSFRVTDVVYPGTGPTIEISRSFDVLSRSPANWLRTKAFADWQLDVPHLSTEMPANASQGVWPNNSATWIASGTTPGLRCSAMGAPPPTTSGIWWPGVNLNIPGRPTQKLLARGAENPSSPTGTIGGVASFPLTTKERLAVGCLPSIKSGQGGEGFLVVDTDGTKYWFDWLVSDAPFRKSINYGEGGGFIPTPEYQVFSVVESKLFPTRIEDKSGNYLTLTYAGRMLRRITASDGREVEIIWSPRVMTHRVLNGNSYSPTSVTNSYVSQVVIQPDSALRRVYSYDYAKHSNGRSRTTFDTMSVNLRKVTLPDQSAWDLRLDLLSNVCDTKSHVDEDCWLYAHAITAYQNSGAPLPTVSGQITSPHGATAEFTLRAGLAGPQAERFARADSWNGYEVVESSRRYGAYQLIGKRVFGPGVDDNWRYHYTSDVFDSWPGLSQIVPIPPVFYFYEMPAHASLYTVNPDATVSRISVGYVGFHEYENKLLREDTFADETFGAPVRSTVYTYGPSTGAYPSRIGNMRSSYNAISPRQWELHWPLVRREVIQDGVRFSALTTHFDQFARPLRIEESSSAN